MSTTIEYNRIIYKNKEEDFVIFANRLGESNVYDHNNQRSKNWCLIMVGTQAEYWRTIGNRLYDVRGGMLQRADGWDNYKYFDPVKYVKLYRSKLKNAQPIDQFFSDFNVSSSFSVKETPKPEWIDGFREFGITPHSDNTFSGVMYFDTINKLQKWLSYFPKSLWSSETRFHLDITSNRHGRGRFY